MASWATRQVNEESMNQSAKSPRPMLWVSLESTRARRDRRHRKKKYSAARTIMTPATDETTMAAISSLRRCWCLSTTMTTATATQMQNGR